MNEFKYPVAGSCQCGKVHFLLKSAPKKVIVCHCKECQKLSTSAFSITAIVKSDDIDIDGELKTVTRIADSGSKNIGYFCPQCGNRIYQLNPDQPEMIKFKAASSLDDTRMLVPDMHIWVEQKQAWLQLPDNVEQYPQARN